MCHFGNKFYFGGGKVEFTKLCAVFPSLIINEIALAYFSRKQSITLARVFECIREA